FKTPLVEEKVRYLIKLSVSGNLSGVFETSFMHGVVVPPGGAQRINVVPSDRRRPGIELQRSCEGINALGGPTDRYQEMPVPFQRFALHFQGLWFASERRLKLTVRAGPIPIDYEGSPRQRAMPFGE